MSSTSETGHINNLANFKTLIKYCTGYGADYKPTAEQIKLVNLQLQFDTAEAAHADCLKKAAILQDARNTRRKLFEMLPGKAVRVVNALTASGAEENTIKSARSVLKKIWGKRAGKLPENPDPTQPIPDINSSSQRGFDQMMEHFTQLLEIVQVIPMYQPNETELQLTALQDYKIQLSDIDNTAKQAETDWSNSRISRFNAMYLPKIGFSPSAQLAKAYVKSVYGAISPQYKQLTPLKFTRPHK